MLSIIHTLELFPLINAALIELLQDLSEDDWNKATVIPGRTVKDLAAHIFDGSIRRLSMCRDGYHYDQPDIACYDDLVQYIQKMNERGIAFFRIVSPEILISLLQFSEEAVYQYFSTLNNEGKAKFPVAWAGEAESENWFDIAREYTEKWHHQMQIRLAVDRPGIDTPKLFAPVTDTFMRGLPHAYRSVEAETGTCVTITVTGSGGGAWCLEKFPQRWGLSGKLAPMPYAQITMSDSLAWRVFTDSIDLDVAIKEVAITGDAALAQQFFKLKAVMR